MTDDRRLDYELVETTLDNGLRVCVQPDPVAPAVAGQKYRRHAVYGASDEHV